MPNVAASLLTTARDYARFLAHLVAQPTSSADVSPGALALRPATREAMTTPQVVSPGNLTLSSDTGIENVIGSQGGDTITG